MTTPARPTPMPMPIRLDGERPANDVSCESLPEALALAEAPAEAPALEVGTLIDSDGMLKEGRRLLIEKRGSIVAGDVATRRLAEPVGPRAGKALVAKLVGPGVVVNLAVAPRIMGTLVVELSSDSDNAVGSIGILEIATVTPSGPTTVTPYCSAIIASRGLTLLKKDCSDTARAVKWTGGLIDPGTSVGGINLGTLEKAESLAANSLASIKARSATACSK